MFIQCKPGPSQNHMPGQDYVFHRDAYGRHVCEVTDLSHIALFLHVEHFVECEEHPKDETTELEQSLETEASEIVEGIADDGKMTDPNVSETPHAIAPAEQADDEAEDKKETDPFDGFNKEAMQAEATKRNIDFASNQNAHELKLLVTKADADAAARAEPDADEPNPGKDLSEMNRDELKAEATRRGVKFHAKISSKVLLNRILEAEDEG